MAFLDRIQEELVFSKIWERFPNKESEPSARKAFSVLLRSEENLILSRFVDACLIYSLEVEGQQYVYKLGNFIRDNWWRDYYDAYENLESYRKKLEDVRLLAAGIIHKWNSVCKPHWLTCKDIEAKIPIVKKALQNDAFKNNWDGALSIAAVAFRYPKREDDPFSKITLSLRWFCITDPEKHTVMRLVEGEYGKGQKPSVGKRIVFKDIQKKDRERALKLFKQIFNDENPTEEETESSESESTPKSFEDFL